jgi:hypothetical protein
MIPAMLELRYWRQRLRQAEAELDANLKNANALLDELI